MDLQAKIEDLKYKIWVLRDQDGDVHYLNESSFRNGVVPSVGKKVTMKLNDKKKWEVVEERVDINTPS